MNYPNVATRVDLAKLCGRLGFKVGAEIGVCKGKFSRVFCWNIPDVQLYCIDTWTSDPNDPGDEGELNESNYSHAQRILKPFNVEFIRSTSTDALQYFGNGFLDFVYIDANHSFDYIMSDLINWSKKVRKGGIVSGHDYYRIKGFGVIPAVDAFTLAHNIQFYTTTDDHTPSWFYIKE